MNKSLLILIVLSLSLGSVTAQSVRKDGDDYSYYFKKINERLAEGNCDAAQKIYDAYKASSGKSDSHIEKRIADCRKPSGSSGSSSSSGKGQGQSQSQSQKSGTTLNLSYGRYVGEVLNGQPHGRGIVYYKDDDKDKRVTYEGEWKNGQRSGNGTLIWKDGDKYIGNYAKGQRNGYGVYYWKNGDRYEGNWKDGEKSGQGKYYWTNGDVDEGYWVNGQRDGNFVRTKKNGTKLRATYSKDNLITDWH